jgi:hypothetical protein
MFKEIKDANGKFFASVEVTGEVIQLIVHNDVGNGNTVLNLPKYILPQLVEGLLDGAIN